MELTDLSIETTRERKRREKFDVSKEKIGRRGHGTPLDIARRQIRVQFDTVRFHNRMMSEVFGGIFR